MYAFAVFKKANYIFSIESVPAYIGRANFLPFSRLLSPKYPLPVGTSEGIFLRTNRLFKKILPFSEKQVAF